MPLPDHSNGPWYLEAFPDGSFTVWSADERDSTRFVICNRNPISHRAEVSRANGHLIVVAPEMIEALRFIADLTGEELEHAKVGTGAEVALRHANRRALEIIAKAEGGSDAKT